MPRINMKDGEEILQIFTETSDKITGFILTQGMSRIIAFYQ